MQHSLVWTAVAGAVNSNPTMLNYRDASDKVEFVALLEPETPPRRCQGREKVPYFKYTSSKRQVIMNLADAGDD